MRITHKHELKNYLGNKRIAVIQKGHRRTHTRIQFTNNRLIDEKILGFNNEKEWKPYNQYAPDIIHQEILAYNIQASESDLQRILQHSLVNRNTQTELEASKVIRNVGEDLTKLEVERVIKNLDYVENILINNEVNLAKYEALVEKLPHQTSRKEVLERCIMKGEELPATKRQAWLERNLERGASYNKQYTYKELNQLSRDLERYKTHRLDYETAVMENRQADREGYDKINQTKTWIWSTLEKTRHSSMDGETVNLTEPFEVINEITGDVDMLMFPGDVTNDHNGCSNICNCYDKYTEFFTVNGFKRVDEITMNDTFLSFNPDTLEPCWLKPTHIIKNRFKGYLNHIHAMNFDLKVTDDHEMYIHYGRHFKPQFRAVKDLKWHNCFVRTIDYNKSGANEIQIGKLTFNAKDFAIFMAWYLSEGSVLHDYDSAKRRNYPIIIAQYKEDNREIIINTMKRMFNPKGIRVYAGKKDIEIRSRYMYDYLVRLGRSYDKYIPKEIFDLNSECLNLFLENYIKGDGSIDNNGTKRIFSTSKQLLDGLSYIALLCGYYPNYSIHSKAGTEVQHHNGYYIQNYDVGCLTLGKTHYTTYRPSMHDKIYYDDYVYCCELPKYHTLWVRSNGKTFIGSNCGCTYEINQA